MRIAYLTAGAAGMYCGSCMRDNLLVSALRAEGVEALLIPTYTPIRTDVEDVSEERVFYGGLGVYLEQRFPLWRKMPRFVSRLLAARPLLGLLSHIAIDNQPAELGELALSVLRGEDGNQRRDLEELQEWLAEEVKPDVVHLTNSLFAGLAPALERLLDVPVLCTLQGEDLFLDGLPERQREEAVALIREKSASIRAFTAVSQYYRDFMSEYVGLPADRIHVVRPGIPASLYESSTPRDGVGSSDSDRPVTIGYLARVCEEKGIGLLAEAFLRLKKSPETSSVRLRVAGYLGPADRGFVDGIRRKLEQQGVADDVEILGTVDFETKRRFLTEIDIFSVPARYREPKGLYVLEALAAGLPVVVPRHGAFPELIEETGGGVLVDPHSPEALAEGLRRLVLDADERRRLGAEGARVVAERFTDRDMARATLEVYRRVLGRSESGTPRAARTA